MVSQQQQQQQQQAAGCRLQAAAAVSPPVIGEAADIFVCKCLGPYDQTWRLA